MAASLKDILKDQSTNNVSENRLTKTTPDIQSTKKQTRKRKAKKPDKKGTRKIWSDEDNALLTRVYPNLEIGDLLKLFPDRTESALIKQASRLSLQKSPALRSAINSANPSMCGIAHFADYPAAALQQKHPDLYEAYLAILNELLQHPSVDTSSVIQVELLKEAALTKVCQYMLMHDRIKNDLKGEGLIINPKTGFEIKTETRYIHGTDIQADAKLVRSILKDLGILQETKHPTDGLGALVYLWSDDEK